MTTRTAVVTAGARDQAHVARFLPSNYTVTKQGNLLVISGEDVAGWGLTTYVIPRLASGLIYAREINMDGE